jgi:hypothetical protein
MAGIGRPPKPPGTKAGHSKDIATVRTLTAILAPQPELPTFKVEVTRRDDDGNSFTELEEFVWPNITREWWQMWADSPLSTDFTSTDWSELRDTAFIHAQYWSGKMALAGELRLRTAKFGATPEDRLRLRIQFAQAINEEVTASTKIVSARDRFPGMRVVGELEG